MKQDFIQQLKNVREERLFIKWERNAYLKNIHIL